MEHARVTPPAPDQTATESSMMFIAANPATATARSNARVSAPSSGARAGDRLGLEADAGERIAQRLGRDVGIVVDRYAARGEVTRAAWTPGSGPSARSIRAMQPAQWMPGTLSSLCSSDVTRRLPSGNRRAGRRGRG